MSTIRVCLIAPMAILALTSAGASAQDDPEARLRDAGLVLPHAGAPVANYVRAVRTGNLIFLAGHGECGGTRLTGKVGGGVTVDSAYASAGRVALCLLGTLKAELGDLRRVRRVVKLTGMVNASPDFTGHSQVINGASDLLVKVFGERGRHARAAVGMASLPLDMTVEIDMVVEVNPDP